MSVDTVDPRSRLETMLSVSRHVVADKKLPEILDLIAYEAAHAVGAKAASIILVDRSGRLYLGGGWDVADYTRRIFDGTVDRRSLSATPSDRADVHHTQIVVADLSKHPAPVEDPTSRVGDWRLGAIADGIRAMVSTPLDVSGDIVGILNVYRAESGPWQKHDLDLLSFLADHAAAALLAANLIDRQHRQLAGLERVVRDLREQTHEHANRVHSAAMLITMGEQEEARRFIEQLIEDHGESHQAVMSAIHNDALAGLMAAELMIARQSGVRFRIDRRTRLTKLLGPLGEPESVALLAHLIGCAFEAIADVPPPRRRITLRAASLRHGTRLSVRDWGQHVPDRRSADAAPATFPSRRPSMSEALLIDAVHSAGGSVRFDSKAVGTLTTVWIPD